MPFLATLIVSTTFLCLMSEAVTQFENTIADYTGASYAVALDSCTSSVYNCLKFYDPGSIVLPKRTFISIYTYSLFAKCKVSFSDESWDDMYQIDDTPILDCAKCLFEGMYVPGSAMCLSFGREKPLSITDNRWGLRGGMILTDNLDLVNFVRSGIDQTVKRTQNSERCFFHLDKNHSMTDNEARTGFSLFNQGAPQELGTKELSLTYPDLSQYKLIKVKDRVKIISHPNDPADRWILDNAKYITHESHAQRTDGTTRR